MRLPRSMIGSRSRHSPLTWRFNREIALRLVADAVMVAAALLAGLVLQLLWLAYGQEQVSLSRILVAGLARTYLSSLVGLLPISLAIFAVGGVYTHGRAYNVRYKTLLVAQAVSLSYVLFALVAFLLPAAFNLSLGALFLAWLLTLVFMITARVWARLWVSLVRLESPPEDRGSTDDAIRNVLVIGGAGYIGSALLPKLLERGYHVRLLDMLLFGWEPIANVANHPNLEIVEADFRDTGRVVEAMRNMDAVIHLGAIVGDPACALDEELTIEVNLMATRMIAEVAKSTRIRRFVFASTCSVYGASDGILNERSALSPVSLYARSKIAAEKVLQKMASDRFSPVILRFGTIYGLSGRTRFDLVVNLLAAKAVVEGQITVFGGDQWRPFVHVDDAALAVFKALEAPRALVHDQVFNVGADDQNYTIQQVGELVQRIVPNANLVSLGMDGDRRNYRVSFGKIRSILGYVPRWTVEEGVQQVIQAIRSGKVRDYQDAQYSNVKYLGEARTSRVIARQNGWAVDLLNETESEPERVSLRTA